VAAGAIGLRVHSGWAALVAVAHNGRAIEVIDRRILKVIEDGVAGAKQPYHYVEAMELAAAEKHLAKCAAASGRLATEGLRNAARDLEKRGFAVTGAAVLFASGRPLPELARTLASHALIHTAEGEFFRDVFCRACGELQIPVARVREKEVGEPAGLRRPDGPPWTQDQKLAAWAACGLLSGAGKLS
jgi:hypothetical protein